MIPLLDGYVERCGGDGPERWGLKTARDGVCRMKNERCFDAILSNV